MSRRRPCRAPVSVLPLPLLSKALVHPERRGGGDCAAMRQLRSPGKRFRWCRGSQWPLISGVASMCGCAFRVLVVPRPPLALVVGQPLSAATPRPGSVVFLSRMKTKCLPLKCSESWYLVAFFKSHFEKLRLDRDGGFFFSL